MLESGSTSSVWIVGGSSDNQRQKETGRVALCTQCKALPAMCGHLITSRPSSFIDEEMLEICNSWEGPTATAGVHVGLKRKRPPGPRQRARLMVKLRLLAWNAFHLFSLIVQKQDLCGWGCLACRQYQSDHKQTTLNTGVNRLYSVLILSNLNNAQSKFNIYLIRKLLLSECSCGQICL